MNTYIYIYLCLHIDMYIYSYPVMSKKNNLIWLDGMLNSCCRQSQCKVSDFPVNLSRQPSCTSRFFGLIVSIPESAGSYRSRTKLIHDSFINNIPCISNKNRYSILSERHPTLMTLILYLYILLWHG